MKVLAKFTILTLSILLFSCTAGRIKVTDQAKDFSHQLPPTTKSPVQISVIHTAYNISPEAFIFSGGSLFAKHRSEHMALYVRHPKGDFLFETGLGKNIDQQFTEMTWLQQKIFSYKKIKPAWQQLQENGFAADSVKTILLSHLHWDHVSGISDFPLARVISHQNEILFAKSDSAHAPAFLKNQYIDRISQFDSISFANRSYGPFSRSFDLYSDHSIILVPIGGHTHGSMGMIVTLQSGKRLFFIGDVVWSHKQIERLKPKHAVGNKYVDLDDEKLNRSIVLLHKIARDNPDLVIVPSHDYNILKSIASFPEFE